MSQKRFTPVRLREGYDMGEVDMFLDEVEAELARLYGENNELRSQLEAAQRGMAVPAPEPVAQAEPEPEPQPEPEPEPVAPRPEAIQVTTVADASSAAARLLEIATRNADEVETGAKAEADRIIGSAKAAAERLTAEAAENVERIESDARARAAMLDAETAERRAELFGQLDIEREKLNAEVENLRTFEREYRSRLKSYFRQQLASLEGGTEAEAAGDPEPKRMRTLLGEDG